ncbi:MAG: hypothetical protein ACR2P5_06005 [Gammaproteobacteria bacterium]
MAESRVHRMSRYYSAGMKERDATDDERTTQYNSLVEGEKAQRKRQVGKAMKRAKGGRLAAMKDKLRR